MPLREYRFAVVAPRALVDGSFGVFLEDTQMKTAVKLLALIGVVAAFIPTSIAQLQGQAQYDLLIRHGRIVDGTGAPWYGADSVRSPFFFSIAQTAQPDWAKIEEETMRHFQAILRFDTSNPPGNEKLVVDYLKSVLDGEGIETKVFALDPQRPNLVARLRGSGKKRPVLIMGHTDVVTVDPAKWKHPPFSATREGGYVYGRGTLDDKPSVAAGLMTMLQLKRMKIPLDRDVIFLAEASEEGNGPYGINFMVERHWAEIEAEYCFAEGGGVVRKAARFNTPP